MNKIQKLFRGVVKSFDEKTHTATIFISTGDIDRDMEVIEPKAFQKRLGNYLAHPVLLSSHRAENLMRQIGEAKAIRITEKGVEGDYEWYAGKGNPEADWGWFLVTKGIAAFSVGFMPFEWLDKWSQPMISPEDSARGINRRFIDVELLENSQVLVPANPMALQRRINEAQGEEKELLEMAVKTIKTEEVTGFDQTIGDPIAKVIPQIEAAILKSAGFIEKITELVANLTKSQIETMINKLSKENLLPKHYSEILLGGGDIDPKHTPTEGAKGKVEVTSKAIDIGSVAEAVKSGVKEGLK